jgi:hypothetical protein
LIFLYSGCRNPIKKNCLRKLIFEMEKETI